MRKAWARERYETVLKNDETHKAKQREISSAHYKKNREHIVARRKARRAEINEWRTQHIRELRAKCIQLYGGKCECCGETRPEFLAFDHINGGGTKQRKSLGGHFVEWLASRPAKDPGIRVLCHNCNSALAFYGYCPHQRK